MALRKMKHDKSDNDFSITALLKKIREEADASDKKNRQEAAFFDAAASYPDEDEAEVPVSENPAASVHRQERYKFRITRKKIAVSDRGKHAGKQSVEETDMPISGKAVPETRETAACLTKESEDIISVKSRPESNDLPFGVTQDAVKPKDIFGDMQETEQASSQNSAVELHAEEASDSSTQPVPEVSDKPAAEKAADNGTADTAEAQEIDPGNLSDDEFNAMLKRFLPDEEYEAYEKSCDLSQTNANLSAVQLEDVTDGDTGEGESDSAAQSEEDDEDTKEFDTPADEDEDLVPPDIDEKDINLMIALGMDEELKKKIGAEQTEAFYRQAEESASGAKTQLHADRDDETDTERSYTSFSQNKEIFSRYKRCYRSVLTRMAVCAILLLFVFFFENISVFGGRLADTLDPKAYPVVYVMVGLQMLLFGAVLVRKQLADGLRALLKLKPQPESLLLLVTAGSVIYDILMCFRTFGVSIQLYHFPVLFSMLVMLLTEFLDLRREIFSFHIVASKRIKYAIGQLSPDAAALETEAFEEYLPDAPAIFKLCKASFIDRFYERMRERADSRKYFRLMLPLSILFGVALYVFALLLHQSTGNSVTVAFAGILMTMPVSASLVYCLPMYFASERAYEMDSAIIGEGSVDEYDSASSVSFDDKEVFPSKNVKVTSVMVFGSNRIDEVIRNVAGVFRMAGGPLRDVLENITSDFECPADVRLLSVASDGIEAAVSGSHMYLGKAGYLRRNHYTPILDQADEEMERSGQQSIMFVVYDDEVVAKMYISYRIDPEFENTLKQLYRSDICVGIKTFDPNIDDDMLSHRIRLDKYPVRVLKCREVGQVGAVLDHTDSGIVSKHSARDALRTFTMCGRIKRLERIGLVLSFIAMFVGALMTGMTLVFQSGFAFASMYVALYQFFWIIPIYLFAKAHVK